MSKYGRVKNLRLVRDIGEMLFPLYFGLMCHIVELCMCLTWFANCFFVVTGASRCYAFVEYQTEREMLRAYEV